MTLEEEVQTLDPDAALAEEAVGEDDRFTKKRDEGVAVDLWQGDDDYFSRNGLWMDKNLIREFLLEPKKDARRLVPPHDGEKVNPEILECLIGNVVPEIGSNETGSPKLNRLRRFIMLSLKSEKAALMEWNPDPHFTISPLYDTITPRQYREEASTSSCYQQLYSFRFPNLGLVQLSCQLFYVIHVDGNGHLTRFVRATITGASSDMCLHMIFKDESQASLLLHPLENILGLFVNIDSSVVRSYLTCVEHIQHIESDIQDEAQLRNATISLNSLNTSLSKLRTTLQYLRASIALMKLNTPELEASRHLEVLLKDLGPDIEKEFEKKDWYEPGFERKLQTQDMIWVQRLLDVESAQQRINISLSAVSNLLAQRDNEWNRNMATSQKTIAMLTMFFLPATFFAILFTLPLFNWDTPSEPVLRPKMWIYWAFTVPLTILLFLCYFLWVHVKELLITLRAKPFVKRFISSGPSSLWQIMRRTKQRDVESGAETNGKAKLG